jgi:SAM-dependent methyltransferase
VTGMAGRALPEPWSHNLHYHGAILRAAPAGCQTALDVGCGQGSLTRRLTTIAREVTGIDQDERSIEIAREHQGGASIRYLCGDFMDAPVEPGSVDLITAVASLHHMNVEAALPRMAELLRPGGVLVVIGLARIGSPADLIREVPSFAGARLHQAVSARRLRAVEGCLPPDYTSPVIWPPPMTYGQTRRLARQILPGARFRRRLYWRYSLTWTKPR